MGGEESMNRNEKLKSIKNTLAKNWTRVWLWVVLAALSGVVGYAVYTEVSSIKRVVSTQESPGEPFSSNCMRKELTSRKLTADAFDVWVCNFDQNYPDDYNNAEITYTMQAELKVKVGAEYKSFEELATLVSNNEFDSALYNSYVTKANNYSIFKKQDNNAAGAISNPIEEKFTSTNRYTVSFSAETLPPNNSSTDIFTVNVDPDDKNNAEATFFVFVTATPSVGAQNTLSARLYRSSAEENEADWQGRFYENLTNGKDYDFYNYIITGTGGGTLKVYWDPAVFEINQFFLEMNGDQNGNLQIQNSDDTENYNGYKMISFSVDSTQKNRYEIQFYKVQEEASVATPAAKVGCEFSEGNT